MGLATILIFFFSLLCSISSYHCYDPLDPNGNITIKWDLVQSVSGTNNLRVSIFNYQQYRHIEPPGWKLSWEWKGEEVIWSMQGAEATEQGNCSAFQRSALPHCCERKPVIVDLLPGAPYNVQTQNCCKGGVLTSMMQDVPNHAAVFEMNVGGTESGDFEMPVNFSLGVPGYSCELNAREVPPSKFPTKGGRRWTQALRTWNVTCMYSQITSSGSPKCCVSMSAFYNDTIVPCPKCSCMCQGDPAASTCVKDGEEASLLQQMHDPNEEAQPTVRCTQHMCPIRVHWHVKQSYTLYWRVKMTVTNFNVMRNYSQWNLVVLHPNLNNLSQIFSFNYSPLNQYGDFNDSGVFWGLKFFNEDLLQAGENGNVQTEMLLRKDHEMFTFREGWAFPRRILFNGDECVMPQPDDYPRLPNFSPSLKFSTFLLCFLLLSVIMILF